ncbi:MAG: alpha-galactosidase, partial [Ferruginibacter sp.]|nr:alpha-galactosidase [Cytophagales bacterium]
LLCCGFALAAASAHSQNNRWTLRTDDTQLVIGLNAQKNLCLFELSNPTDGWNWTKSPSVFPLIDRVTVGGTPFKTNWVYQRGTVDQREGTKLTLVFTNAKPALELKSVWEARQGRGPVRHSMFLKNNAGKTLTIPEQESIEVRLAGPAAGTSVVYINDDASLPDSIGVYQDPLVGGYRKTLQISEAHNWIPFIGLNANRTHGLYIGWEWSIGRINVAGEANSPGVLVKVGNGDDFRTDLYAGETFEVPPGFIGTYHGDLDDGGNSLRQYLFNYALPAVVKNDPGYPKVEWNAFAATGKELGGWDPDEKKYYPLIDDIAPLGFEEVVIDVGWWSNYGDPGHIVADPKDWPSGMAAAAKYAHDKGLRFGLYDNEPEYLTSSCGRSERIKDLSYLIHDLKADFYRSDATAGRVINGTYGEDQRAHYPEDVGYWSTKGFYAVIDSMYKKVPGFLWENCASGGGLKDYGACQRAAKVQNQDRYFPIDARRSFYDASYAMHPLQLAALTGSFGQWQAAGSVYEFRSSSLGAAYWHPDAPNGGNGGPVWSAQQKAAITRAVDTYKRKLRPLIRNANLYHIFPRPNDVAWDGIEYYDPATQKGVVYVFQPKGPVNSHLVKLKGLAADLDYTLTFEDGTNPTTVLKGAVLMNQGIPVTLKGDLTSELMFIEKK